MAAGDLMRIGLDFDNTIIRYDEVFLQAARERGLLSADFVGTKQQIRDAIRGLPDGEAKWQALQGYVYGSGIGGAKLFGGLPEFLRRGATDGGNGLVVRYKNQHGQFHHGQTDI